jgi:hypothetical protein
VQHQCGSGERIIRAAWKEAGTKRYGRGGRGVGVEETRPSHLSYVGSGAEGSGPNTSTRSGAGAGGGAGTGGTRIRETRTEQAQAFRPER